jgi:hypothetical protein
VLKGNSGKIGLTGYSMRFPKLARGTGVGCKELDHFFALAFADPNRSCASRCLLKSCLVQNLGKGWPRCRCQRRRNDDVQLDGSEDLYPPVGKPAESLV